jgi:hypothetical protein
MTESEGVVTDLSMRAVLDGKPLRPSRRMYLRPLTIVAHQAVIAYVCLGWTVQSRVGLFLYLLFLPLVAMQWLFNHGTSIITNLENWARTGHWHDPENPYEGHLFQTLLAKVGVRASTAQIDVVVCTVMFIFWMTALFRMMVVQG